MDRLLIKVWDFEGNDGKGCWIEELVGGGWDWHLSKKGHVVITCDDPASAGFRRDVPCDPGRFDILLWTGWLCRTGEGVYDGHIIKTSWQRWTEPHVVVWPQDYQAFHDRAWDADSIEIIGHKHTHPELLLP